MKLLRNRRIVIIVLLVLMLAAFITGSALAGGWATIELDELPGEIHAGETFNLSFMVYQHGKTPVHSLIGWDPDGPTPVEPVISVTNSKTGETIEIMAVPDKSEVGRFHADILFPSEGEWSWTIEPTPLAGATELAALTILPELKAPMVETGKTAETAASQTPNSLNATSGWVTVLRWTGGLLLVGGVAMLGVFVSRRRRTPVIVESGD